MSSAVHRRGRKDSGAEGATHELRTALANLRAAAEALAVDFAGKLTGHRAQLLQIVTEEAARASRAVDAWESPSGSARQRGVKLETLTRELARGVKLAADLDLQVAGPLSGSVAVDAAVLPALTATLARLRRDFAVSSIALSATHDGGMTALDFRWPANEPETEQLREAHTRLLSDRSERGEGDDGAPSLREATRACGGEAWIALRRGGDTISLRVLLPRMNRSRGSAGSD